MAEQPNILVLELGMVTRPASTAYASDSGDADVVTLAVHPFLVRPAEIRYQDTSRSRVQQTTGGGILTRAGRALQQVSLTGTFGVKERSLGVFVGTGDQRFKRMWHEIVRLSDAVTEEHVNAEKFPIASPTLSRALRAYDKERSTFFVNFYDFWHNAAFECHVQSFGFRKAARGAAAAGLTHYTMALTEVGPIVTSKIGISRLRGLFESLTTWSQVNESIRSWTSTAFVDGVVSAGMLPVAAVADSVSAVNAQIDAAVQLLNGYTPPARSIGALRNPSLAQPADDGEVAAQSNDPANGTSTLQSHLGFAARLVEDARDVEEALLALRPAAIFDGDGGAIWWETIEGEGGIPALDVSDRLAEIARVIDAANFQAAVGAFYGMSREEYAAFLSGSGGGGRLPALAGTQEHLVRPWDTIDSIESVYGVGFDDVLRLNRMLPGEALRTGVVLQIPRERPLGPPTPIDGLPTFGSHAGRAAWGADLWADLRTDSTGRLLSCDGGTPGGDGDGAVLIQGVSWLIETYGDTALEVANQVPGPRQADMYALRLAAVLTSDARITSVDSLTTKPGGDGVSVDLDVTISAINGGRYSAGVT